MLNEKGSVGDSAIATLQTGAISTEGMGIHGYYHVLGHDKDGNLMWEENFPNLVNAVGKQLMLDTLLRTSGTYTTVGPYLGLLNSGGTFAQGDTFASHTGWTEFISYTVLTVAQRGLATFNASTNNGAASPSNIVTCAANAITYAITGTGTVGGCFLLTGPSATASFANTTLGTLYSAGNFTSAKAVSSGDTLTVTYSTTAAS
jgi:hypothetical protein